MYNDILWCTYILRYTHAWCCTMLYTYTEVYSMYNSILRCKYILRSTLMYNGILYICTEVYSVL